MFCTFHTKLQHNKSENSYNLKPKHASGIYSQVKGQINENKQNLKKGKPISGLK